jgi:hypothetical protein
MRDFGASELTLDSLSVLDGPGGFFERLRRLKVKEKAATTGARRPA